MLAMARRRRRPAAWLRRAACSALAVALLLPLGGCGARQTAEPPLPDLLVGALWLERVELPAGTIVARRLLPGPATDLKLAPGGELIGVATRRGAALLDRRTLAVRWSEALGIVDALVFAPSGDRAYLLEHPGDDPHEAAGPHAVLEIEVPGGRHRRRFQLDERTYDLVMAPGGGALFATDLVGRSLHRIDLERGTVTTLTMTSGAPARQEPEQALLRLMVPGLAPGRWLVAEDRRGLGPRLWALDAGGPQPLEAPPAIAGPLLGGGAAAGHLWLHGLRQLLRLDADFNVEQTYELAAGRSHEAYRWGTFDAARGLACFIAPVATDPRRPARSLIQWWDLEHGRRLGRRSVACFPGPLLLVPRLQPEDAP